LFYSIWTEEEQKKPKAEKVLFSVDVDLLPADPLLMIMMTMHIAQF